MILRATMCWILVALVGAQELTSTPAPTPSDKQDRETHPFKLFRVCSAPATGELFRFNLDQQCPSTLDKVHEEGILLVFKTNIVPYIFSVRRYRKAVTLTTVYRGLFEDAVTHRTEHSLSVHPSELSLWDQDYECFNSAAVNISGYVSVYTDHDGLNRTVPLSPVEGLTASVSRFNSQPELYADPSWFPGIYRTRTTVNCELMVMPARSAEPYSYFVTAVGDTIEVSPFTNVSRTDHADNPRVYFAKDYSISAYDNRSEITNHTRVFVDTGAYTISFEQSRQENSVCRLALWKYFARSIRTNHTTSWHFVANEVTATFTTPTEPISDFSTKFPCAMTEINETIDTAANLVKKTHVRSGPLQFYETEGHLFLVWAPLRPVTLDEAERGAQENGTQTPLTTAAPRRARRSADVNGNNTVPNAVSAQAASGATNDSVDNLFTPQIQFAYDRLQDGINTVLAELSRSWCREQVRANNMWYELSKISPTSVMTAIYGKPVSAKRVGDAFLVTDCITVDQRSVSVHKSMMTQQQGLCYARPPVTFRFQNGSTNFIGQLGMRNEILLTSTQVEDCQPDAEHYFFTYNETLYYKNYAYQSTFNISKIAPLDTFIALNISFIENIDFKVVELYSKDERRLSSVFDLETMFREYNYYTTRLSGIKKDLDNTINNNRDRFIQIFSDLIDDLGAVGKVLVNGVSVVFSFFGAILGGIVSFFKNPLGGMLILVIVVGVIVLVFLLRSRTSQIYQAPAQLFYPDLNKKPQRVEPISKDEATAILLGLQQLHRDEVKPKIKDESEPLWTRIRKSVRRRRAGYSALQNEQTEDLDTSV